MTPLQKTAPQETDARPVIEQKGGMPLFLRSGLGFLWEVLKTVAISVAIILFVRYFLFKPFYVKGASMEPNFYDNEYLIINEVDYRFREPLRGDIVVLRFPRDPKQFFIKRVIGLPKEKIDVENGNVIIYNSEHPDGFVLHEDAYLRSDVLTFGDQEVTLGADEYFVLGDNRPASLDSRSSILGPVHRSEIVGRVWFRVWPFSRFAEFRTPSYPS